MKANSIEGYRELEHTADWQLAVWAPDFPTLCVQAAYGMYHLADTRLKNQARLVRELEVQAQDRESLLVAFLTELLYLNEVEGLGFDEIIIQSAGTQLKAQMEGAAIESQTKEIKAVTYHGLEIREGPHGLEANIVFDV